MKDLKRANKAVILSVDSLSDDYRQAIKDLHGQNVQISLETKRFSDPKELVDYVEDQNRRDTAVYVSTSTCDGICMLNLANQNFGFGIFQHSPTDGNLLRLLYQQEGRLSEVWNPVKASAAA